MKLSLIIPAYNEEKRIFKTLESYKFFLDSKNLDYKIIVVLNGCKDNTQKIVEPFLDIKTNMLVSERGIGKGGAIMEGFKIARGEYIGFVDADSATSPEEFYKLFENLESNKELSGVIASRYCKGAKILQKQPLSRRFASRVFNLFIRGLFGLNFADTQCGAKIFKKEAIKKILPQLGITKWSFDIDLLYLLKKNKFKIKEFPTIWSEPGESKLKVLKTSIEMFLSILRLRLVYSPLKFIVKIYDWSLGKWIHK